MLADPRRAAGPRGRAPGADDLRPPRGHRGHDEAPPGGGPPPDGRHARTAGSWPRTSTSSWTPAPTRRSRRWCSRAAPSTRPGPYRCPNVRVRARAVDDEHGPRRRVPRLRRAPDGVRRRGPPRPDRRGARDARRRSCAGASPTARATSPPTGQVLRHSVAAIDVLERAEEASDFEAERADGAARERARRRTRPTRPPRRPPGGRVASGVGLALGWHGAGFTGSGEKTLASVAGDRARRPTGGSGSSPPRRRSARAPRRSSPRSPPTCSGVAGRGGRAGPARHGDRAQQRADGRLAHDDGRRRPRGRRGAAAPRAGGGTHRAALRRELPRRRRGPRPHPDRRPLRGLSRHRVGPGALPRRRLPGATAGRPRSPSSTWTSTPARSPSAGSWPSTMPGAS